MIKGDFLSVVALVLSSPSVVVLLVTATGHGVLDLSTLSATAVRSGLGLALAVRAHGFGAFRSRVRVSHGIVSFG